MVFYYFALNCKCFSQKSVLKDAESQTNVSVRVTLTANSRNEAHELRKEMAFTHTQNALARAREISNLKSGYTTATYTGSNISTPTHMRTRHSIRNADSDSDLHSRSYISESNMSTSSNTQRKRTHVSFRNDEYSRLVEASRRKRKANFNRSKTPSYHAMKSVRRHWSEISNSTDNNSTNKLADTGYEGSGESRRSSNSLTEKLSQNQENDVNDGVESANPEAGSASHKEKTVEVYNDSDKNSALSKKSSNSGIGLESDSCGKTADNSNVNDDVDKSSLLPDCRLVVTSDDNENINSNINSSHLISLQTDKEVHDETVDFEENPPMEK